MRRLFLVVLILVSVQACSQPNSLRAFFEQKKNFNGAVLITQNDKILHKKAYGLSDFDKKIPNTSKTQFRIGSITKQFTAALILILESEGLLKTDDFINKYLLDYPNGHQIRISDLIHHTSGIPNFIFFEDYPKFMNQRHTTNKMMARFKDLPLEFEPSKKYNYSNSGYFLLGVIIEKVTGVSFEDALNKYIFSKLNLKNTGINNDLSTIAMGHIKTWNGLEKAPSIDLSVPFSAGAMYSTIDDLYKWNKQINGNFLEEKQKNKRLKPNLEHYGFGVWIDESLGQKRIWHTGGINGFRAVMSYYPATKTNIIVLCNTEMSDIESFEIEIAKQIFKQ